MYIYMYMGGFVSQPLCLAFPELVFMYTSALDVILMCVFICLYLVLLHHVTYCIILCR